MPLKADSSDRDRRILAVAAARLRAEGNRQEAVAEKLKRSQPEVSRLLELAEKEGFYNPNPSIVRREIGDADWKQAEQRYFADAALVDRVRALAPRGAHCEVFVCQ